MLWLPYLKRKVETAHISILGKRSANEKDVLGVSIRKAARFGICQELMGYNAPLFPQHVMKSEALRDRP